MDAGLGAGEPFPKGFGAAGRGVNDERNRRRKEQIDSTHKRVLVRCGRFWPDAGAAQQLSATFATFSVQGTAGRFGESPESAASKSQVEAHQPALERGRDLAR